MTFIIISALAIAVTFVCILPLILQWRDRNKPNPYGPNKEPIPSLSKKDLILPGLAVLFIVLLFVSCCIMMAFEIADDPTALQGFFWFLLFGGILIIPFLILLLLVAPILLVFWLLYKSNQPIIESKNTTAPSVSALEELPQPKPQESNLPSAEQPQNEPLRSSIKLTELLQAVLTGDMDFVKAALENHPEFLNTAYAQNGNTPLHVAALNGYTEIVRLLLAQPGIDKTLKNNDGKTAQDLALEKGFAEIAQMLEK